MKILKKNILVLGAIALTLTLFSFKPANYNEINTGETIVKQETLKVQELSPQESAKLLAKVANAVKNAAKAVGRFVKQTVNPIVTVPGPMPDENICLIGLGTDSDRLGYLQYSEYKMNKL